MRTILIVAIMICAVYFSSAHSKINKTDDELQKEIEGINSRIEQLYITENIESLISHYTDQLTFFPEYKPAIFEVKSLRKFYKDWFQVVDIKGYCKKIYKVEVFSDYVLELGSFSLSYSSADTIPQEYNGKYMKLWKRDNKGKLSIVSEGFGAHKYIEPEDVPYAAVQVEESNFIAKQTVSEELLKEVKEFDTVVLKAVAEGDGDARAKGFTEDAILMSNFDSIRVGMDAIRPKMLKTYNSTISYNVDHTYYRIYDLGDFAFVNAHYKGGWGDTIKGGKFEGNMMNLMKRNEKGILLMHRQFGNRDKGLLIFDN